MRISVTVVWALTCRDSAAIAAVPTDSFKNSRRFIAVSWPECRNSARSLGPGMMVLLRKSVECSAKIAMRALSYQRAALLFFQGERRTKFNFPLQQRAAKVIIKASPAVSAHAHTNEA